MKVEVLDEVVTSQVAAVRVKVTVDGISVTATGAARKDPLDKADKTVGKVLAYGRAIEAAGRRLVKRGDGIVAHKDDLAAKKDEKSSEGFTLRASGSTTTDTNAVFIYGGAGAGVRR